MRKRTYLDLRCDVTDLTPRQRENLAMYLTAQTETCDGDGDPDEQSGYPGVEYELDWVEVEDDEPRTVLVHLNVTVPGASDMDAVQVARAIEGALEVGTEGGPDEVADLGIVVVLSEEV